MEENINLFTVFGVKPKTYIIYMFVCLLSALASVLTVPTPASQG